jgi:hypothetical protein
VSPAVQVIVVAWNSGVHLQRCLDALAAQTFTDWEAVVWDNASTDGAVDRLRPPPNTEIVRSPDNLGFAAANNRAAERSSSRWIALLNPTPSLSPTGWSAWSPPANAGTRSPSPPFSSTTPIPPSWTARATT